MSDSGQRNRGKNKPYEGVEGGMKWEPEPYPTSWIVGLVSSIGIFVLGLINVLRKIKIHK